MFKNAFPLVLAALQLGCSPMEVDDASSDIRARACGGCVERVAPELFDHDELVALSALDGWRQGSRYVLDGPEALGDKLDALLSQPFVSNEAFYAGARPHRPNLPALGPALRAMVWNIERGQELPLIEAAFAADALAQLDVIVLNEVDLGMKRSGYANVAERLAQTLGMNYAFAVEFVEVDPIALGLEHFEARDFLAADGESGAILEGSVPAAEAEVLAAEAHELSRVDPQRARNLHGNAILSRYPIVDYELIPLTAEDGCWDWNADEKVPKDLAGKGMDVLAEKLFLQKSMREIRHGGRGMLRVDLLVPGVSAAGTTMEHVDGVRADIVTVVNVHLEAKSTPACRQKQMQEVLSHLAEIKNPVIMAGDLNSVGTDGRPMTVERLLLSRFADPAWIARQMVGRLAPYAGWAFMASDVVNWLRLKDDPTGIDIPLLLPNAERGLFDAIENHRFADGGVFDFRGDETRTVNGTKKTLANSNQRDDKGFKTTFAFQRTFDLGGVSIFGRFKLDWMFVRGWARSPRDPKASYRFAPHFPRTLEELRDSTSPRLSDHAPMTVVLPLGDPCGAAACDGDAVGGLEYGGESWEDANAEE